jgi:hypothetical protein
MMLQPLQLVIIVIHDSIIYSFTKMIVVQELLDLNFYPWHFVITVALSNSKVPQNQLDQIFYNICFVHFTLQKFIRYNATQHDLAFIMIILPVRLSI